MRRFSEWLAVGGVLVAIALGGATAEADEAAETPLDVILKRAGEYVLRYGESFRNLTAEEKYKQWETGPAIYGHRRRVRMLRSDIVFVRTPGALPWASFRDVFEVDGRPTREREQRLQRLLVAPTESSRAQMKAILDENSRYNLHQDEAYRNVNVPTLGLLFLLPENQKRLSFTLAPKDGRTIAGFLTVAVRFEESSQPTLVRNQDDQDMPARGSFWIDPVRGAVLRTEIDLSGSYFVATQYRRETGLDVFVPDTMRERCRLATYRDPVTLRDRPRGIAGHARYSKYRRFQVTSEWEVGGSEAPQVRGRGGRQP
jgi:hypothetical protein